VNVVPRQCHFAVKQGGVFRAASGTDDLASWFFYTDDVYPLILPVSWWGTGSQPIKGPALSWALGSAPAGGRLPLRCAEKPARLIVGTRPFLSGTVFLA